MNMADAPASTTGPGKIDWLASYPKSGNTWLRLLLAEYFNERDEPFDINKPGVTNGIASSRARFDELLGVNSADLNPSEVHQLQPHIYEMMTARNPAHQWIKVHDAQIRLADGRWLFPPHISNGVIYLIRNPLDIAVSMAFHGGHEDMDKAVAKICDPEGHLARDGAIQLRQFMGSWSDHAESWIDQKEMPVLVVRYEDMLAGAADQLERVIRFARPTVEVDKARLELAAKNTAFDRLRATEDELGFRETPTKAKRFFRSGKAGGWRDHLTGEHVKRIRAQHGAVMDRFGFDAG
jgi:aryl sulfotransferase